MNGETWAQRAARSIATIKGRNWAEQVEAFVVEAGQRFATELVAVGDRTDGPARLRRDIAEADHATVIQAAQARRAGALKGAEEHATRKGSLGHLAGKALEGVRPSARAAARVPVAVEDVPAAALASQPIEAAPEPPSTPVRKGVRGPSRHSPAERAARADERWRQVHLTGASAEVLRGLRAAACAVLSIIVMDCRATAEGLCERSVARLAGSACVSERAVQYALPNLVDRGLITIERRDGDTHRITVSDEIVQWGRRGDAIRHAHPEAKNEEKEEKRKAPPRGAKICEEEIKSPVEPQERLSSETGCEVAEKDEQPSAAKYGDPGGIAALGPMDAFLARIRAEFSASDRCRRDEGRSVEDDPDPGD